MKRLFIESPCFGFGPISTSLSLAERLNSKYEIWFISFGEALLFLRKCSNYSYIELDTRIESEFDKIRSYVVPDDLFITNTNVEFSTYLINNGYKVVVIDTLYWMWNSVPKTYSDYRYFIVQKYYGHSIIKGLTPHRECKPIINYSMWSQSAIDNNRTALISFGGMSEPGDNMYILSSAQKMINCIDDILPSHITDVYVIGGLFSEIDEFPKSSRIHILGYVDAYTFNKFVRQSKYIFLSPGLTSLYEMIYSKKTFCLLPGLNVSQVYQVYHFNKDFGYEFCVLWPEVEELIKYFSSVPELDGIDFLRGYVNNVDINNEMGFHKSIRAYVDAVDSGRCTLNQGTLMGLFKYPAVDDFVIEFLKEIENE